MGQKVSPIGLRLGINKTWESKWFAESKDFSKYLNNDYKIRKYLEKKLKDAAVSSVLRNSSCKYSLTCEGLILFCERSLSTNEEA